MPDWIEKEAIELHQGVINLLKKDIFNFLLPKVARFVKDKWGFLSCEEMFDYLIDNYPDSLITIIKSNVLNKIDLSFAAEILGKLTNSIKVRNVLIPFLDHPEAIVREGVIYGLQNHMDEEVKEKLKMIAEYDSSEMIIDIAKEVLEENV